MHSDEGSIERTVLAVTREQLRMKVSIDTGLPDLADSYKMAVVGSSYSQSGLKMRMLVDSKRQGIPAAAAAEGSSLLVPTQR